MFFYGGKTVVYEQIKSFGVFLYACQSANDLKKNV